jgi:hypothetical protein
MTLSVGTLFKCRPIENSGGLYRTASECLETQPDPETLYVMCKDGSISDPGRPIGDRLTQTGFESKKCEIEIVGLTPEGRGFIGTQVYYAYSRDIAFDATSQHAQITDGDDDDEDEVTSSISFYVKD